MITCEKPFGRNAAEAPNTVAAGEATGRPNMVWCNYRRVPTVTLAKQPIDVGRLGRVWRVKRRNKVSQSSLTCRASAARADLRSGGEDFPARLRSSFPLV